MSTVLAMRFNDRQGILVADESTWHLGTVLGYRRTNYGDALASLLEPGESRKFGLAAVYAGVGFPSFHHEVARRAREALAADAGGERRDGTGISRTVQDAYMATHTRMLEDKLRFNYGFGRDALNSRSYSSGGATRKIGQEPLVEAARTISGGRGQGNAYDRIFDNGGLAVVHDRQRGMQSWYLGWQGRQLGFATPIAVLGDGSDVATHLVARFVARRDLKQRRAGFGLEEGLYIALNIATEIGNSVNKMGGYLQIMFIDGERGVRELVNDAAHMVGEVMRAHLWGFLKRTDVQELITALVVDGASDVEVEKLLFERASDPDKLRRYLYGFKPVHAPAALATDLPECRSSHAEGGEPDSPSKTGRSAAVLAAVTASGPKPGNGKTSRRPAARKGGNR